jgi:hypothetical protein
VTSSQYPSITASNPPQNPSRSIPALSDSTYYPPPPIRQTNPSFGASATTSRSSYVPQTSTTTGLKPSGGSNTAPKPMGSSSQRPSLFRGTTPAARESTNLAPKSPPLISTSERTQTTNPFLRRTVGTAPNREASKKSPSAPKGRDKGGDDSDSDSTISISKDDSSDSDSSLDVEDLLGKLCTTLIQRILSIANITPSVNDGYSTCIQSFWP